MKIVLIMDGGVIQQILCDEAVKVAIVDYDVDGIDECQRTSIQLDDDAPEEAFTNIMVADVAPGLANKLYGICEADSKPTETTPAPAPAPTPQLNLAELERIGSELAQALFYWLPGTKVVSSIFRTF
jgi:hypothetical protein